MNPIHLSTEKSTIMEDAEIITQRIHGKQSNNQCTPSPIDLYANDGQEQSLTAMITTKVLEAEVILERLATSSLSIYHHDPKCKYQQAW